MRGFTNTFLATALAVSLISAFPHGTVVEDSIDSMDDASVNQLDSPAATVTVNVLPDTTTDVAVPSNSIYVNVVSNGTLENDTAPSLVAYFEEEKGIQEGSFAAPYLLKRANAWQKFKCWLKNCHDKEAADIAYVSQHLS